MAPEIQYLKKISGLVGRYNDILYASPITLSTVRRVIVYFGGDVQDICESMKMHKDSKNYLQWSLESTLQILAERFPQNHVMIVRPSRMEAKSYAVFSCYDNFVPGNEYGVPKFCSTYNASMHLMKLLRSVSEKLSSMQGNARCNINEADLTLVGFSKGCVVLNQLLHEFHYIQTQPKMDESIHKFISQIKDMWWLDGGHGGNKNTWITDETLLKSFARMWINVHVHVTPYQIQDDHRPWIRAEERSFCEILRKLGIPVERTLHFQNEPRSLSAHFKILTSIKDKEK